MIQVPIGEIVLDSRLQMRAAMDFNVIDEYADHVDQLPPCRVFQVGEQMLLTSGWHRFHGFKKAKRSEIPCEVMHGDFAAALLDAAGQNHGHGIRRTNEDKRRAVGALLGSPEFGDKSDRMIARACHVSDKFVAALRVGEKDAENDEPARNDGGVSAQTNTEQEENSTAEIRSSKRVGQDGKSRPASRPKTLCARCRRVGVVKDCPNCKQAQDANQSRESRRTSTHSAAKAGATGRTEPRKLVPQVIAEPAKPRKSQPITDTRCKNLLNLCAAALSEEDADKALELALDAAKKARELCLDLVNHPTLEEVQEFIAEAKVKVDAEMWLNHYQSNGWMVGKQRMRDWRACVLNWGRNSKQWERSDGKATGRVSSPQSSIDAWERKAARTRA